MTTNLSIVDMHVTNDTTKCRLEIELSTNTGFILTGVNDALRTFQLNISNVFPNKISNFFFKATRANGGADYYVAYNFNPGTGVINLSITDNGNLISIGKLTMYFDYIVSAAPFSITCTAPSGYNDQSLFNNNNQYQYCTVSSSAPASFTVTAGHPKNLIITSLFDLVDAVGVTINNSQFTNDNGISWYSFTNPVIVFNNTNVKFRATFTHSGSIADTYQINTPWGSTTQAATTQSKTLTTPSYNAGSTNFSVTFIAVGP